VELRSSPLTDRGPDGDPCETFLIVCLRRDGGLEAALAVVFEPASRAADAPFLSGEEAFAAT